MVVEQTKIATIATAALGLMLVCLMGVARVYNLSSLLREDGPVEYLSAVFWMVGCVISLSMIMKTRSNSKILAIIFVLVCFVSFGEELSWGQRLIGFDTPSWCRHINRQGEFNLHNLRALSGGSTWTDFLKTGRFSLYQIFDAQNMFRMGFFFFFFLLPLFSRNSSVRSVITRIGYETPPLSFLIILWTVIIVSGMCEINAQATHRHEIQEIRELSYAVFVTTYLFFSAARNRGATMTRN